MVDAGAREAPECLASIRGRFESYPGTKEERMYKVGEVVNNPSRAYKALLPKFRTYIRKQETFVAIALNSQLQVIGKPWRVSLGTANETTMLPRDLFREAIKRNAVSVIIAHNHPSGKVLPSEDDRAFTNRIKAAGELVGIQVADHLVVGPKDYWSFADHGQM